MLLWHHCLLLAALVQQPTFEVASVKPATSEARGSMRGGPGTPDPGRIAFTNVTLFDVLLRAYDLQRFQLSAPDWLSTQRYDITATVPPGVAKEQCNRMLQTLLADRFRMALHHETRELQGFDLTVGRGTLRLKRASAEGMAAPLPTEPPRRDSEGYPQLTGPGLAMMEAAKAGGVIVFLTARSQPIAALTGLLTREFRMPIADKTGLEGGFDFKLSFAPRAPGALPAAAPDDDAAPNLTTAVQQQLGLRLNPRKIPTDVIVIDRADKTPTEN